MNTNVEALKKLAVKLGCAASVAAVTGSTVAEVIDFIEDNYSAPVIPSVPSAPTEAGDYKLVVADGVATWTKITG